MATREERSRRAAERRATIVEMRDREGMTFVRIGEVMGFTPVRARELYLRGKRDQADRDQQQEDVHELP